MRGPSVYELIGALMSPNTKLVELNGHIINALYPAMVDADLVAAQFDVVRHVSGWNDAFILQQRALACPSSMVELHELYSII